MAMELTPQLLRQIADKLEEASKVSFEVESIKVGDHKVLLKLTTAPPLTEHQLEIGQCSYKIIGITKGDWGHGPAMRGGS